LSCVSSVGVDLNTASPSLLARVSGLAAAIADAIVQYRSQHGPFKSRRDLLSVPRLGPKAFEQAAGFLRIPGAANPLDDSAVHPESYPIVDRMAADLGLTVRDLLDDPTLRHQIPLDCYVTPQIGLPTLQDILAELAQPGRDPRADFEPFHFAPHVRSLADLQSGMTLPGIVTNVTHFGAFVDVGLHDPGLIPTHHLANHSLHMHQPIQVTIQEVDLHQNCFTLSLHSPS
ncbi:MAG: helix-hairpin-helix domain-containing protein, partial [Actinomycetota bacterium]